MFRLSDYMRISQTPETFYAAIPQNPKENIEFRKSLHSVVFADPKTRADFLAKCFADPRIFFNTSLWTFNPQNPHGQRNIPFILWPHQEPAVLKFKYGIDNGVSYFSDKSRKQGATYIILGLFLLYWLMSPGSRFLLGSRKENLVDDGSDIQPLGDGSSIVIGSEETLFYKLLYMLSTLPLYLQPRYFKKNLFLQNLEIDTGFRGEATNKGFGKAFRGTATMIDEAAQIEPPLAQWIIENLGATANCNIFNSTVGPWGGAHPYSKLIAENLSKGGHNVVLLDWLDNPTLSAGKYKSPKEGYIRIDDLGYYRKRFPGRFDTYTRESLIPAAEVADCYPFVADGGVSCFGCYRTVWYDDEEKRPENTRRSLAQNVLRINSGSTDMFFDIKLIHDLRDNTRPPDYYGDVEYSKMKTSAGYEIAETAFCIGGADCPLEWWGHLDNRRPNQFHNYTVGCDISRGTGTSNSVAAIKDVNTNEIVGIYATPYLKITDFAEKVVGICQWVGGQTPPLLNWELNNSPEFLDTVRELGYYNLYVPRSTDKRNPKLEPQFGWRSTGGVEGSKRKGLNKLTSSLSEGLLSCPRFGFCKIYSDILIDELESYVNFEGKSEVGPVTAQTETSGAKAAHGDRCIAVMLADMASETQEAADECNPILIPENSFLYRMREAEEQDRQAKEDEKIWWY